MKAVNTRAYEAPEWIREAVPASSIPSQFVPIARRPTPLHRWHLLGVPEDTEVWIKRDDLTGCQLSGNKVRKLEFLMAEAARLGHDSVVTLGGIQSNHARATAVAANLMGIECHLVLRTSRTCIDEDPGLVCPLHRGENATEHTHFKGF